MSGAQTKLVGLLVGSHFHPPAKTLIEALPTGAPLELLPEPENPYDESAVLVRLGDNFRDWLLDPNLDHAELLQRLEDSLPNQGMTLEQVLSTLPLNLGHLGASGGKPLAKSQAEAGMPTLSGNLEFHSADVFETEGVRCTLAFAPSGAALVEVEITEE